MICRLLWSAESETFNYVFVSQRVPAVLGDHTSNFHGSLQLFSTTIDAGLESVVQIDTVGSCWTNQSCPRSTPSHTVISVTDLEVKFNFPQQQQAALCSPPAELLQHSEAISSFRRRKDRIL